MEDKDIVDLYWARNELAIKQTKDKYENYCGKIAYNILFDYEDAKECLNDTYLKTWNSIPSNRPSKLGLYVGKICRNLAINMFEKYNASKRAGTQTELALDELSECLGDKDNVQEYVDYNLLRDSINNFLRKQKKQNRVIFIRRYFYMSSIEEIAKEYGMSLSNVKVSLKRTRDSLKDYLIKQGYDLWRILIY